MPIQIKAPDGSIAQFPDGTDDATITSVMAKTYGGPTTKAAAPAPPAPKRSLVQDVNGVAANFSRGTGVLDEASAGLHTLADAATGRGQFQDGKYDLGRLKSAYEGNLATERGMEDTYSAAHPIAAKEARSVGQVAPVLIPAAKGVQAVAQASRLGNIVRGATLGAATAAGSSGAYALADRGTVKERLSAATTAMKDPVTLGLGAVTGGIGAAGLPTRLKSAKDPTAAQTLTDAGVSLTPGQKAGGLAKNVEDLAMRAPIVGSAIAGARDRGVASLNRAVANRALAPLGEGVPATVKVGHDAVNYVSDRLGKAYDDAAEMVPQVGLDGDFHKSLQDISKGVSELPTDIGNQFSKILENRLAPLTKGPVTGQQLRSVQSQISKIAAERSGSQDVAQQGLGHMLEGVSDALKEQLGRASPEAGSLIQKANEGWASFVRMRSAASKAKGGVFTPGQLTTAVRQLDKSVGKGNVAKGKAVLQDLSGAASEIMPDQFGNPGTANAMGLGALGATVLAAPTKGIPAAVGLTAAATPYLLMGRKIVSKVPDGASPRELRAAASELDALVAKDPAVKALRDQIASRLAVAEGAQGGSRASDATTARTGRLSVASP